MTPGADPDLVRYLDFVERVFVFALDSKQHSPLADVSPAQFLEQLYVPRDDDAESRLREAAAAADSLTLVAGPAGGGKTSILRHVLAQLEGAGLAYAVLDFKALAARTYDAAQLASREVLASLGSLVRNELSARFLGDVRTRTAFLYEIIRMFHRAWLDALQLRYASECGLMLDDEQLARRFAVDYKAVSDALAFVAQNATTAEVICATKKILDKDRFLIVFDNADRLSASLQPYLISFAVDLHNEGQGEFGTIIALRQKSLLRYQEAGEAGDVVRILSLSGRATQEGVRVALAPPPDGFQSALLGRRLALARRQLHEQQVDSRGVVQFLEHLATVLDEGTSRFDLLAFTNHSARSMLTLASGLATNLLKQTQGVSEQPPFSRDVATQLFYGRVFHEEVERNSIVPGLIRRLDRFARNAGGEDEPCLIEFLILAWLSGRRGARTRFGALASDFRQIGFKEHRVAEAVYGMYDVFITHRLLELGTEEHHYALAEVTASDLVVDITPRGEHLVSHAVVDFEYLYQAVLLSSLEDDYLYDNRPQVMHDIVIRASNMLWFLRDLARYEAACVARARSAFNKDRDAWDSFFRDRFCVDRKHLTERIVAAHLSYLKGMLDARQFAASSSEYRRLLDQYESLLHAAPASEIS